MNAFPPPPDTQPDYGIPDDPFHPPKEAETPAEPAGEKESLPREASGAAAQPSRPPRRRRADRNREADEQTFPQSRDGLDAQAPSPAPPVTVTADGSRFEPPARAEVPDWLLTAQRLNPSPYERPIAGPRVQAAPRADAGAPRYAPSAAASAAPSAPPAPGYAPPEDWEVEEDEPETPRELPAWVRKAPWLGIAAFVAVMAAIAVWIQGMQYETQTRQVLDERAAQEQALYETYPLKYEELIQQKAEKYNLSPAFVAAIMLNESSFRPDATSSVNARGLMQLMDDTAGWIHGKLKRTDPYDFNDLYDPEINVEFGCWYLQFLSERFRGDPILVAAAFHAGQGEVQNWLNSSLYSSDNLTIALGRLPEGPTKQYVCRVLSAFAAYKRLYYGG